MTEYYKGKLEAGLEYQDFISDELRKYGIILSAYTSRKWQNEKGESASGIEIKHDMRMHDTGNLYIEVAEKANPNNAEYVPSGIMRDDNTWLYLIGDYTKAFLFSKKQVQSIYTDKGNYAKRGIKERQTPTSIGFTYPIENAMKYLCLKCFTFEKSA